MNPLKSKGGLFDVEPYWPEEHANIDPSRKISCEETVDIPCFGPCWELTPE